MFYSNGCIWCWNYR